MAKPLGSSYVTPRNVSMVYTYYYIVLALPSQFIKIFCQTTPRESTRIQATPKQGNAF